MFYSAQVSTPQQRIILLKVSIVPKFGNLVLDSRRIIDSNFSFSLSFPTKIDVLY